MSNKDKTTISPADIAGEDIDIDQESLENIKTIHITSDEEDVLGDIDICRFDTLSDMRHIMESTWDGVDLYWPAGFRFYVDGEKVEREDEEKWSVMRLPMVVDVRINEDFTVGIEDMNKKMSSNDISSRKREREIIMEHEHDAVDGSPCKKGRQLRSDSNAKEISTKDDDEEV